MGGNFSRAINHTPVQKFQNTEPLIPHGGIWHMAYLARKRIKKGDQLLTDYGQDYWDEQEIKPAILMP